MENLKKEFYKIDYLSPEQETILGEFLNAFCSDVTQKKIQLEFLKKHEVITSFDTAIPINIVNQMREIYPEFDTFYFIWDYSEKSFGELKNTQKLAMDFLREKLVLG